MLLLIRLGLGLATAGVLLTVVKIGFDIRSIGDLNLIAVFVGAAVAIVAAQRRFRRGWPPPTQSDRL